MRQAVKVNVHSEVQVVDLDAEQGSLKVMQDAVGGWVQPVDFHEDLTMWVNEEGKLEGLIPNRVGNAYFQKFFGKVDVIVGDVIFTGGVDDEGEMRGLTDDQVKSIIFVAK